MKEQRGFLRESLIHGGRKKQTTIDGYVHLLKGDFSLTNTYIAPELNLDSFNCPFCEAYAHQTWGQVHLMTDTEDGIFSDNLTGAYCAHCQEISLWDDETMIFPLLSIAPQPVEDMPDDVKEVFEEARLIAGLSPRAAVALLRLALQLLLPHIGGKGKNIDADIGALVKAGLSPTIQKALDSVRVVGNNAVHPGVIDLRDNPETANWLFVLLNFVVTETITRPRELETLYQSLPQPSLDAIKKRDGTSGIS